MSEQAGMAAFRVEEATIEELHAAIRDGRTTVVEIVRQYIARAQAYNGVASLLVTEEGAPVPQAAGAVRAGTSLAFPTETVAASTLFPDLDQYAGKPLEFGRMEGTASDPAATQQYGMIVGKPDAGQL
ncbi:MAG: amidase, partial [Candidatus Eiseniibacteriota bacterium]